MGKHIIIKEARCSFPRLYGAEVKEDGGTFGPGITLVLEKERHSAVLAEIKADMRAAIVENPKLKKNPPTGEKLCLRAPDRDELKYEAGNLVIKANNPRPPIVLEPDGHTVMTEATDKSGAGSTLSLSPYSMCQRLPTVSTGPTSLLKRPLRALTHWTTTWAILWARASEITG